MKALLLAALALAAGLSSLPLRAGPPNQNPGTRIYVCTDANGKRLTSDRPIVECLSREQRLLNPDGSVRSVLAPPMTASERAAKEARDREAAIEEAARHDAIRVDRLLLNRYPDEPTHQRAREAALNAVREASELSRRRMAELAVERKVALGEAEFYKTTTLPPKLRYEIESNEAATASQRVLIQGQEAEAARIHARFDSELERLRRLWAGAPSGSLGPLRSAQSTGVPGR